MSLEDTRKAIREMPEHEAKYGEISATSSPGEHAYICEAADLQELEAAYGELLEAARKSLDELTKYGSEGFASDKAIAMLSSVAALGPVLNSETSNMSKLSKQKA